MVSFETCIRRKLHHSCNERAQRLIRCLAIKHNVVVCVVPASPTQSKGGGVNIPNDVVMRHGVLHRVPWRKKAIQKALQKATTLLLVLLSLIILGVGIEAWAIRQIPYTATMARGWSSEGHLYLPMVYAVKSKRFWVARSDAWVYWHFSLTCVYAKSWRLHVAW